MNFLTVSGVAATRVSTLSASAGTAIFIDCPRFEPCSRHAGRGPRRIERSRRDPQARSEQEDRHQDKQR